VAAVHYLAAATTPAAAAARALKLVEAGLAQKRVSSRPIGGALSAAFPALDAASDRKDSGLFPQGFVMNPPGPQSSGKGSYGGMVKMLPPHLHLKGWDVSTEKYKEWYRSVELFKTAHQIPRGQWAAPIVAACQDKAHQALKNLDVLRLSEPGAIEIVTYILSNTFMRPQEDRIDEYKKKYDDLRRSYGMTMADYLQELEMAEALYLSEDSGTRLSQISRAKKLINGACLRDWERAVVRANTHQIYDYNSTRTALLVQFREAHLLYHERKTHVRFGGSSTST
jgi:hypothetical protein